MRKIDIEELKIIQMNILSSLQKFCMDNRIKYSLADGSLIGAIRHKGYIPWDDDIDVFMLRDDYEKLLKLFPLTYENNYKLCSLDRDRNWVLPFAKIYDDRTIYVEKISKPCSVGVNIDIFPLDKVPAEGAKWRSYNKKRLFFQKLFWSKQRSYKVKRSFYRNMIVTFSKLMTLPISYRRFAVFLNNYSQRYSSIETDKVFECAQGLFGKSPFLVSDMDEVIEWDFEDRRYWVMKGYDDCLTSLYGDYMKLPPKDKQVNHHIFEAYWK